MATILIIEDDENLQFLMSEYLNKDYRVLKASNGLLAFDVLGKESVDLIIADVMMPKMNGYDFVSELRECGYATPVIIVTAKQELNDKRAGFKVGADDYMTKPIAFDELRWRIVALLRRAKIASDKEIAIGKFNLNITNYEVIYDGEQIELAGKEFQLLYKLLSYPNRLFSKDKLMEDIWGYDSFSDEATIRTHFNRLRNKIEKVTEFEIINIRGIGYKAVIKVDNNA